MKKKKSGKIRQTVTNPEDIYRPDNSPIVDGVILDKVCECGKYKPVSTRGLIDLDCRNCGGSEPKIRFG